MIVFVVPVHSRHEIASVCLRQLRVVCDELGDATAVMVGAEKFFSELAHEIGFEWINSPNAALGRKWNDGIWYAGINLAADYIVRFGSDDVVHPSFFDDLPDPGEIVCTRRTAIVSPDGARLASLTIDYEGGDGVQIVPASLWEPLRFRPALDDRQRAVDASITQNMRLNGVRFDYRYLDNDPLAIIDFKTDTPDQRNTFLSCLPFAKRETDVRGDVFEAVASMHGDAFASEVAGVYGRTLVVAA